LRGGVPPGRRAAKRAGLAGDDLAGRGFRRRMRPVRRRRRDARPPGVELDEPDFDDGTPTLEEPWSPDPSLRRTVSIAPAWLDEFCDWIDGLLGDRLSAALARVGVAVARGTVEQGVAPELQRYAAVPEELRKETQGYSPGPRPIWPTPTSRSAPTVLWPSGTSCGRSGRIRRVRVGSRQSASAGGGLATADWAAVAVVVVGGLAWAASEIGAAWAISTQADAEVALAQVRLQQQEHELEPLITAAAERTALPMSTLPPPATVTIAVL